MSITFNYFYGKEADQFNFIRIPKLLFTDKVFAGISNDAKVLYALMLDRMNLSRQNNWFDNENRVYIIFTIEEAAETMNCGNDKIIKLFKELDDNNGIGLITRKRRGLGKPSIIYVRNFVLNNESANKSDSHNERHQDIEKAEVLISDNPNSRHLKNRITDIGKSKCNKTYNNQTDMNNTDNQSYQSFCENTEIDGDKTEEIIKSNIDYDILVEKYPEMTGLIDEIKEIIVNVVNGERSVTLDGKVIPYLSAKNAYLKLSFEHIVFLIDNISKVNGEIKKFDRYLCTSLYNAAFTYNFSSFIGFTTNTGMKLIE